MVMHNRSKASAGYPVSRHGPKPVCSSILTIRPAVYYGCI